MRDSIKGSRLLEGREPLWYTGVSGCSLLGISTQHGSTMGSFYPTVHARLPTPHKATCSSFVSWHPSPGISLCGIYYQHKAHEAQKVVQLCVEDERRPRGQHPGLTALDIYPLYYAASLNPSFLLCKGRGDCSKKNGSNVCLQEQTLKPS